MRRFVLDWQIQRGLVGLPSGAEDAPGCVLTFPAMASSASRALSMLLLLSFLSGLGTWSLHAKAYAHEVAHQAGTAHDADHDGDHPAPEGDGDHALLHALGSAPAAMLPVTVLMAAAASGIVTTLFSDPAIARSPGETPFRPPRALRG